MKLTTIIESDAIPLDFTGIVEYPNGDKEYYLNGAFHREDGPAIDYINGHKEYWLNSVNHKLSKEEFDNLTNSCHGKTIEIDGKKYVLFLKKE